MVKTKKKSKGGRRPSNKVKSSKIKKLIKLAKSKGTNKKKSKKKSKRK